MHTFWYSVAEVILLHTPYLTTSRPLTAPPDITKFVMHTHETYEIYCFLSGDADYYVEGTVYPLLPGDILIMKKAEAHSLLIKSPIPYQRVVVHFSPDALLADGQARESLQRFLDDRPLGKQNRYPAALFPNTHWRYYLEQIHTAADMSLRRAYLTVLISEMAGAYPGLTDESGKESDLITQVIGYINHHLTEEMNLEQISKAFFLSKAQMNRRFKKATGSTVWEYVQTKRVFFARELLQKGQTPTNVFALSGFRDYGTFYRAYKAAFGVSPGADRLRVAK